MHCWGQIEKRGAAESLTISSRDLCSCFDFLLYRGLTNEKVTITESHFLKPRQSSKVGFEGGGETANWDGFLETFLPAPTDRA